MHDFSGGSRMAGKRVGKRSGRSHCRRNRRRCNTSPCRMVVSPQLRIDFRNDADNVVSGSIYHKDGTLIEYIWLRVRVRNVGQRIAKTCQVYLTSLYKVLPGGKTAPDPVLSDAKIVQWAGGSKSPIDIPQGIDLYADLLSVPKASGGWGMIFGLFAHQKVLDLFDGTYEFHLMVSGDNAEPHRCKIRVKCKETAKNFEAWQVDDD